MSKKTTKKSTKRRKKRRVRYGRIAILALALVTIIAICIFSVSFIFKLLFSHSSQDGQEPSSPTKTQVVKKSDLSEEMQERVDNYMKDNPNLSEAEAIRYVKMNMDLEPYEQTTIIRDDKNPAFLLNKFNALPEGYIPPNLEDIDYVCTQGVHFSCTTMEEVQLRSEAKEAYEKWVEAAQEEGIDIVAIAAYRTYEYQKGLWDYYAETEGKEYADKYYARPGQSEHNTGLAVDITFNNHNFNEIELYGDDGYDWILNNAHKFGFILRYPEDKVDITRYEYESWHFRYVGVEIATECYNNDWCLEEYYGEH